MWVTPLLIMTKYSEAMSCKCSNCHFVKDPGFAVVSVCQRFPPVPTPSAVGGLHSIDARLFDVIFIQPKVTPGGFCGEWKAIE
jgi:hypothetical protein